MGHNYFMEKSKNVNVRIIECTVKLAVNEILQRQISCWAVLSKQQLHMTIV